MTSRSRDLLLLTSLGLALLLGACRDKTPPEPAEKPAEEAPAPTADHTIPEKIHLRGQGKDVLAVFKLAGERPMLILRGEATRVFVRRKQGRDFQWVERGQGAVLNVKGRGKELVLQSLTGEPLWRLHLSGQRILAFQGPEEEAEKPAFTLRRARENVVKTVGRSDEVIGSAVIATSGRLRVTDASKQALFKSANAPQSSMFGVLLVPDLDPVERHVLMAEILLRQN